MQLISNLVGLLRKPFPQDESWRSSARTIVGVSVFVTLFLYVFKPFDIDSIPENQFLMCAGFGAMTLLASLIVEGGSRLVGLKTSSMDFTFGRWIVYMTVVILAISLANFLFVRLVIFGYVLWEYFPYMVGSTFAVGVFPTVVLGGLAMMRLERKHQTIAREMNSHSPKGKTAYATDKEVYSISADQIRYAEALQNYVQISYANPDGELKQLTERTTLKQLMEELEGTSIAKCHRSYLVNRDSIVSVEGNAQGLLLTLSDCDKQIPVSRSLVPVFRDL